MEGAGSTEKILYDTNSSNLLTINVSTTTNYSGYSNSSPTEAMNYNEDMDIAQKFFKGLAMSVVILATILGNVMVIVAVCKVRNLRTMNNYFIVSLAVADLLVGLMVQPFNMYNEMVQREWKFGIPMCNLFNSNDVFFSTASLLHLCCISCDRYIAILHPFAYDRAITKFRVMLMIAGSWILSAILSFLPIFAGWYATKEHLEELHRTKECRFEVSQIYAFISSSISFWIPSTVMVVLYQRILSTALSQEKQIRALMRPPVPNFPEDDSEEPMLNGEDKNKDLKEATVATPSWSEDGQTLTSSEEADYNDNLQNELEYNETNIANKERFTVKKDIKQMKKLRKEHRAAKTLGIIMGSFILCMGPIFLWYTITFGICPHSCTLAPENTWVITLVFWIGYCNSGMNPIIYAFFNRDFQQAFKRLFRSVCNKHNSWRKQSVSSEVAITPPVSRKRGKYKQTMGHSPSLEPDRTTPI